MFKHWHKALREWYYAWADAVLHDQPTDQAIGQTFQRSKKFAELMARSICNVQFWHTVGGEGLMDIENLMVAIALVGMYERDCRDHCGYSLTRQAYWYSITS